VRPDATVVEVTPGAGYWTEILAPLLREKGRYLPAVGTYNDGVKRFEAKYGAKPELYGKLAVSVMDPPKALELAPAGSADFVLTFRNVHNWMKAGTADAVFAAFAKALKPGGVLGVEEHRADSSKPQDPKAESGYVREDYVIALAEKAGFALVDKSDINANPKDTKDYPGGVWTLPPTLRLGDVDKAKYTAIGESDRMLLKFRRL
jgi:predicted methyltransferase